MYAARWAAKCAIQMHYSCSTEKYFGETRSRREEDRGPLPRDNYPAGRISGIFARARAGREYEYRSKGEPEPARSSQRSFVVRRRHRRRRRRRHRRRRRRRRSADFLKVRD